MFSERKLKYWDEETNEVKEISIKDLDEKLKDLAEMLKRCAGKLQRVSRYDLKSFEVSLSIREGQFVMMTVGSIRLVYEK